MCALLMTGVHLYAQVDIRKLDAYYAKALKDWNIPGMSIAIVKDGKVVFAKGYGVKVAGKPDKPDENTLYAIASNSKAFTASIMAQLVQEGKVSWDDKVRQHLPYFELYDPWVSEETTVRDLLCHRVGLGTFAGDVIWYRSQLSAEDIVRRAKYIPKAYDYRAGYGYSNVMFITAGELIAKVTGKTWSQNVQERFFVPLGMTRTITTTQDLDKKGNYASPHGIFNEEHKPIAWEDWGEISAMGGIVSSVNDMAQWMLFNLGDGSWKGQALLSKESRNALWTMNNAYFVDHTDADNSTHFRGYGLGWGLADYQGRLRVSHTGGYSGMLSAVTLIPDEKLGVVVLTNGMRPLFAPLVNYTVDAFLKAPEKDWSAEALASYKRQQSSDTRIADRKKARIANTQPSLPREKFAGDYTCDLYGKISVREEGGKLKLQFEHSPDLNATLEHWHYDVWEIKWNHPDMLSWFSFGTVQFILDNNQRVTGIQFDVPNDDIFFEELKPVKIN